MEKRLILAIVLSFIVIFLYQAIFFKNKPQELPAEIPQADSGKATAVLEEKLQMPTLKTPETQDPAVQAMNLQEVGAAGEETVVIETSLFRAEWTNRGAGLKSWKLKKHQDEKGGALEMVSSLAAESGLYPFYIMTEDRALDTQVNGNLFLSSVLSIALEDGQRKSVKYEYSDGKSVKAEKILTFEGGRYDFGVEVNLWKNGQKVEPRLLWGPGIGNPEFAVKRQQYGGASGLAVLVANKVYRVDEKKYKPEQAAFNFLSWAAYEDNYTAVIFITPPLKGNAVFLKEDGEKVSYMYLSVSAPEKAYIGPKQFDKLRELGLSTKKLINFGFFGGIAEILLIVLKAIHKVIPNWGVAIILMTLFIKILFFPLTYHSTKSMSKMQELQPKIKALRAKYKKAKQDIAQRRQMNEEMMRLYKEHGINPAGGCLPILIQIPVFWGVFRLLVVAIELRHSPFFFWIKDLSARDPFYVTPILMGVTQFISQKMTPTTADPAQARIMLIMPFIMTIFFMNFQSGLVLYWLTNNVLQIGQQYLMNRMMAKKKREVHGKK